MLISEPSAAAAAAAAAAAVAVAAAAAQPFSTQEPLSEPWRASADLGRPLCPGHAAVFRNRRER